MAPAAATLSPRSAAMPPAPMREQGDVDAAVVGDGHVLDHEPVEERPARAGGGEQVGDGHRGNARSSSTVRIAPPTWPVAP